MIRPAAMVITLIGLALTGCAGVATIEPGMQWHNIETSLAGAQPRWAPMAGNDVLTLAPQGQSVIELPANHWLRVDQLSGQPYAVSVAGGDGAGLFAPLSLQELDQGSTQRQSRRLLKPSNQYRQLLLDNQSDRDVSLALYRGEPDAPTEPTLVRPMTTAIGAGQLQEADRDQRHYALAGPEQPLRLDGVAGRSLRLELRPLDEPIGTQPMVLLARDVTGTVRQLSVHPQPLARHPLLAADGCWRVAGAPHTTELEVPKQADTVWLEPSVNVAIRVADGPASWRWPQANRAQREPQTDRLAELERDYRAALTQALRQQQSQPEARALQAVLGQFTPGVDDAVRERFWRSYTFWRAVPGTSAAGGRYRNAKLRRLSRSQQRPAGIPPTLNRAQALGQIIETPTLEWVQLSAGQPLRFVFPPRALRSQLQVLTDASSPQAAQIAVGFDDTPPQWLHYRPNPQVIDPRLDAAVAALQSMPGGDAQSATALGPTPVIDAVAATLALPTSIAMVTLQLPAAAAPRWVALRYREVRTFNPDQQLALEQFDRADLVWASLARQLSALRDSVSADVEPVGDDTLLAYWPPLLRLLVSRRNGYVRSIDLQQAGPDSRDWPALIEQLDAAGERGLPTRLRRALALQHQQPAARDRFFTELRDRHLVEHNELLLQGLLAARLLNDAERAQLQPLAESLQREGEFRLALLSALAMVDSPARNQLLLSLGAALDWPKLSAAAAHRAGLADQQPGPTWTPVRPERVQAAGRVMLYTQDRALYFSRWVANPAQPLRLALSGPGQYRLAMRPLHDDANGSADVAVQLAVGDAQRTLSISANRVRNSLQILGDSRRAGDAVRERIEVTAGAVELQLRPSQGELLVSLERIGPPREADSVVGAWRQSGVPVEVRAVDQCRWYQVQRLARYPTPLAKPNAGSGSLSPSTVPTNPIAAFSQRWQDQPSRRESLWRDALQLALTDPSADNIQALRDLTTGDWRRVDQVLGSAGLLNETVRGWQPESDRLQVRQQLLDLPADYWPISAERAQTIALDLLRPTTVAVDLLQPAVPFSPPAAALVELTVNGKTEQIELAVAQPQRRQLRLPAGANALRLRRLDSVAERYPVARITRAAGDAWLPIDREFDRTYHVSSARRPLRINLDQPALLRINSWDGDSHQVRYQLVAAGELRLPPPPGQSESWLRVFRYQPEFGQRAAVTLGSAAPAQPLRPPPGALPPMPAHQLALVEQRRPQGDEDGTWSLGLGWQRRQELDAADDEALEEFSQFDWTYRVRAPALVAGGELYSQSQLLLRHHRQGDPLLGARQWFEWLPRRSPYSVGLSSGYWQQQINSRGQTARSYLLQIDAERQLQRNQRWRQSTRLALFGRDFNSAAENIGQPGGGGFDEVDQDIASGYKLDHRYGWVLRERHSWRHRLDSQWYAEGHLRGNEFGDDLLDQVGVRLGWRNYLNGLTVDAGVNARWFLADDDRRATRARQRLFMTADWLDFPAARWGWRGRAGLVYDLDRDEASLQLRLVWLADDHRGATDFRPRSLAFRSLHQRRQQWRQNDQHLKAVVADDG